MKRLLLVVPLLLLAGAALAFDTTQRPARIAVLRADAESLAGHEPLVERAFRESLIGELRARGFDAFDAERTREDARDEGVSGADYAVEIAGNNADAVDYGGVDINGRSGGVSMAIVASRVLADVYVYDGTTMELVASNSLAKKTTALLPTGVGVGTSSASSAVFAWVALPFIERAQVRKVARAAAADAAMFVTSTVRGQ